MSKQIEITMKRFFALFAAILTFACTYAQSTKAYKIGDYYNDGLNEGVVFQVSADGSKGKIVSMKESGMLMWSSSSNENKRLVGANSATDGSYNMSKITAIEDWETKYPAFEWCHRQGEGWYLPSKQELYEIRKNKDLIEPKLTNPLTFYWSSTEQDSRIRLGEYCAWVVNFKNTTYYSGKRYLQHVRAVFMFDSRKPVAAPSGKTYAVGDFYDDGVKQGYVFEVDASGKRGKLMSAFIGEHGIHWAYYRKDQYEFLGVDSPDDGRTNLGKIIEMPDWRDRFPAFDWCANVGDGWYLPSNDEIQVILTKMQELSTKVPYSLKQKFMTSTEKEGKSNVGSYAYIGSGISGRTQTYGKIYGTAVLAVTNFDSTRPSPAPEKKKYHVGDYYDDGKKEGIVFEVSEDGNHGKIVSLAQSERMPWCTDPDDAMELIGVNNDTDGAKNQAMIMEIPDWETKYPAFKWCADLGEGWYLPSKREMHKINQNKHWIEQKGPLSIKKVSYWTSTESDRYIDDEVCSWLYYHFSGNITSAVKTSTAYVRAVATF